MAAVFGKIEEFNAVKEDWSQCVEHLQHFVEADGVVDEEEAKKSSIFLTLVGPYGVQVDPELGFTSEARR